MAEYTGLDGLSGNAFTIVAGGFTVTAGAITFTAGEIITQTVLTPDSTRTDRAISIGTRVAEKDITIGAGASQHLDPIQVNLNIIGVNPGGSSTVNASYMLITHDTTAMTNIRLKCSDWNVVVGVNVLDAYCMQGEVDFTGALAVGGESAVLGLVMNAGSSSVTGKIRGIIISMQGTGAPTDTIGIELRSTATTTASGIKLFGTPQMTHGIMMGEDAGDNQGPVNAFWFPTGPSADEGPVRNTHQTGEADGSIQIRIGSNTRYLQFWNAAS